MNYSTVNNNTKGGIWNERGTLILQNSIVANNTSSGIAQDCSGAIKSSGHNLITILSGCNFTADAGDQIGVNPMLTSYPLGDLPYYALLNGSPALDVGDPATCPSTDQRGITRPQGAACDIGAYEYTVSGSASSVGTVSGSDQRAGPLLSFSKPLIAYVVDNSGSPVSGVNVTFTAPTSGASGTFAATGTNTTTMLTNTDGIATSSIFTANSQLGTYNVTTTAAGVSGSTSFVLTNASWFVSPTGNDGNSCSSPSSPCLTINAATGKAFSGDAVKVAAGTYTGSSSAVVTITKDVILSGGWNNTFTSQTGLSVIDGQAARQGISSTGANVTIDRFIIQNGYTNTYYGGGIYYNGGSFTVNASLITNNRSINGGGIYAQGDLTLSNSTISKNVASSSGGGISIAYSTNSLILNNSTVDRNQSTSYGGGRVLISSSGSGTPGRATI